MRLQIFTIFRLFTAALTLADLNFEARAADGRPHVSETNPAGNVRVLVQNKLGMRTEMVRVRVNGRDYSMPDEKISGYNQDDDAYRHDFYLSPDQRWLFVTRKLYHGVDVAYLYHRAGAGTFVRVRPSGLRFDEAAVRFFSRRFHLGLPDLEAGARVTYFEEWANGGKSLVFRFDADKGVEVRARYDLRTQRFSLISKIRTEFGGN